VALASSDVGTAGHPLGRYRMVSRNGHVVGRAIDHTQAIGPPAEIERHSKAAEL